VPPLIRAMTVLPTAGLFTFSLSLDLPEPVAVADVRVVFWGDDGLPALDAIRGHRGRRFVCRRGLAWSG
jgi:hypothetical protein